jgi:hypothetical protein
LPLLVVLSVNVLRAMPQPRRLVAGLVGVIVIGYGVNFAVIWGQNCRYMAAARFRRTEAVVYYRDTFTSNRMSSESARINAMLNARDYSFFDDPILRFTPHPLTYYYILHAPLPSLALLSPEILPVGPPSLVSRLLRSLMGFAWCFGVIGAVMGIVGLASGQRAQGEMQDNKNVT